MCLFYIYLFTCLSICLFWLLFGFGVLFIHSFLGGLVGHNPVLHAGHRPYFAYCDEGTSVL